MDILIIGGTGVLSLAVSKEALKRGIKVSMINRGNRPLPEGATLLKSDKDDLEYIAKLIGVNKYDAVIDFLCFTDAQITKSFEFYKKYTNQYFFISSCAVYDTRKGGVMTEESPKVLPVWKYSVDKWASEEHLIKMAKKANINYTIVRPCVTYDNTRIPYGIVPPYGYHWTLVSRIMNGKPIIRWNQGENRCNMMRVEDFAVGVVGLIGNKDAYNQAFNVCGDETPSFNEVMDIVSRWLNKEVIYCDLTPEFYAKQAPNHRGEILGGRSIDSINSNNKIKSVVPDFAQKIGIEDGIIKTLEAYKEANYQKGISWTFDGQCDRIIKKWCKKERKTTKNYNLQFIDYLGNATKSDWQNYKIEYNKGNLFIDLYVFIKRVFRKMHLIH